MFFDGSNAHVTYADILAFIVAWFAKHTTPFTVSQMVDEAVATIGNVTADGRKLLRNRLSIRLKRLVEINCLSYTHNPAPQANDYDITTETMNILTDPAREDKVAALLDYFNLFDQPNGARELQPIVRQPQQKMLPFKGKQAGTSKDATAMRQINAGMTCTLPNGTTINFNNVAELTEFMRQMGGEAVSTQPVAADVLDFKSTVAAVMNGQAEALKNTIAKLADDAKQQNKRVSLRFLSLALSQWDRFLAGVKYDISYNFCVSADDVPCNVDDCDTVFLHDAMAERMCDYLSHLMATVSDPKNIRGDKPIVIPTMQAANKNGEGVEKTPCAFRSQNLVKWDYRGKPLPAHLKAKLPVRETNDE
jgi:hypothetical protein